MTGLIDFATIDRFQQAGTAALAMIDAEINRQAAMIAYLDDYYLMMWLSIFATPMVFLMRKSAKAVEVKSEASH